MTDRVIINEVGPRDGLQNQSRILTPAQRLELIEALAAAGVPAIEAGAFVSPKAVPAMAGSDQVLAGLPRGKVYYSALIPNLNGYHRARAAGARAVAIVIAATDGMNRANIRMSTAEALEQCGQIAAAARADGVATWGYVATAWECPYEGPVQSETVLALCERLDRLGVDYMVPADTIGAADPAAVGALAATLVEQYGADRLGCHFHDTRGMALANVYAALAAGIRRFDASIGGLGGCPFAPGATGNVATEDVALMLQQMGYDTGIDLRKLLAAVDLARSLTGNCPGGHAYRWLQVRYAASHH